MGSSKGREQNDGTNPGENNAQARVTRQRCRPCCHELRRQCPDVEQGADKPVNDSTHRTIDRPSRPGAFFRSIRTERDHAGPEFCAKLPLGFDRTVEHTARNNIASGPAGLFKHERESAACRKSQRLHDRAQYHAEFRHDGDEPRAGQSCTVTVRDCAAQ